MIEAVLDLPVPIRGLDILNPEIPEDAPGDKSVVLDIRVKLEDNRQIDLEMQSAVPPGTKARFLYYWAKGFVDTIARVTTTRRFTLASQSCGSRRRC